jgi:ParB family chromosome partitioning protein
MKRQALGRGLSALLSEEYQEAAADVVRELELTAVVPAARQPRSVFEEAALAELAQSIAANGVLQPIVVRRDGQGYEIVAGERRWRAAQRAGLRTIPVVVRDVTPDKALELALIENLQREDLNPLEQARAYEWLIRDYGLSQEDVAVRVGKERSTVTNTLRLLKLPAPVQDLVAAGKLSMGHARALLSLPSEARMCKLAEKVVREGWSVRQVEQAVRLPEPEAAGPVAFKSKASKDVHDRAAERRMEERLGTKVTIQRARRGGRIEVAFYSDEELQRLFELLVGEAS